MSQNDDENTDDGIWRATIQESHLLPPGKEGFNTDDGIWRATMLEARIAELEAQRFQYR